jgi:hypothetical protein
MSFFNNVRMYCWSIVQYTVLYIIVLYTSPMLSHCHRTYCKLNLILRHRKRLIMIILVNSQHHLDRSDFNRNPRSHPSDPEHGGYHHISYSKCSTFALVILVIQRM